MRLIDEFFLLASRLKLYKYRIVKPGFVAPITALRTWVFTFSFVSIGLTARLREFSPAGGRPFLAFTAGVAVNVILGFVLSVLIFGHYWAAVRH
jgi:uncharacterized membrane protein YadS